MADTKTFVRNPETLELVRLPYETDDVWTILSVDDGTGRKDPPQNRTKISAAEVAEMYTEKVDRRTKKKKKIINEHGQEFPTSYVSSERKKSKTQ